LTEEQIATLDSLELVDDYPLYTMHYHGDAASAGTTAGWTTPVFVKRKQTPSLPWACSLFAALGDADNKLYGRNFDWEYSPALLLFTDPSDGYASASMVDIAYLGFGPERVKSLVDLTLVERQALLRAPSWPFDGFNERGLAVGMAAVPAGDMRPDPDKETIGSLMVIREMLDHAANVDEAVAIIRGYNVDMGGGPSIHYLIADSTGRSALIEFYRGEMVITFNETDWHLATNFLRASVGESAVGQCWRYDKIEQRLTQTGGRLDTQDAMELLSQVAQENTEWSIVYGMNTGDVTVVMGQEYDDVHVLHLE
jgi:choloylglycine hydrolase